MWLMASRCVSWTTWVWTSMVMLIWEWPRISITARGATPAAVRRVAVPCRASQPDDAEAGGLGDSGEGAVQVARLDRAAGAGGEDVGRLLPPLTRLGTGSRLPHAVPAQGRDAEVGQRVGSTAAAFGVVVEDATAALHLLADVQDAVVEVDVRPPEVHNLSLAHIPKEPL